MDMRDDGAHIRNQKAKERRSCERRAMLGQIVNPVRFPRGLPSGPHSKGSLDPKSAFKLCVLDYYFAKSEYSQACSLQILIVITSNGQSQRARLNGQQFPVVRHLLRRRPTDLIGPSTTRHRPRISFQNHTFPSECSRQSSQREVGQISEASAGFIELSIPSVTECPECYITGILIEPIFLLLVSGFHRD
jgi:hypothetical protein